MSSLVEIGPVVLEKKLDKNVKVYDDNDDNEDRLSIRKALY